MNRKTFTYIVYAGMLLLWGITIFIFEPIVDAGDVSIGVTTSLSLFKEPETVCLMGFPREPKGWPISFSQQQNAGCDIVRVINPFGLVADLIVLWGLGFAVIKFTRKQT